MKLRIDYLITKYDAATVFVTAATVVVIIELSLMRLFIPSMPASENPDYAAMMDQVCTDTNVLQVSRKLTGWEQESTYLIERLSGDTNHWQKELVTSLAFSDVEVIQEITKEGSELLEQQILKADYAQQRLNLQSVMIGRTLLANINGRIYRVGDDISIDGGDIVMTVVEISSDRAVIQLVDAIEVEETTRTIYLSRNGRVITGIRN